MTAITVITYNCVYGISQRRPLIQCRITRHSAEPVIGPPLLCPYLFSLIIDMDHTPADRILSGIFYPILEIPAAVLSRHSRNVQDIVLVPIADPHSGIGGNTSKRVIGIFIPAAALVIQDEITETVLMSCI